jgi:hypothetical protein
MNIVKQAKLDLAQQLDDVVSDRVNALILRERKKEFEELKKTLQEFKNICHDEKRSQINFDESGFLVSRIDLDLSAFCEEEFEVIEEILNLAGNGSHYFGQDQYSQGRHQWYAEINLGESVIFEPSPERNQYAIHSSELSLKVSRVTDEEHGLALIEEAQRKHGVFTSVVKVDRYGNFLGYWNLSNISDLGDQELAELIERKESETE